MAKSLCPPNGASNPERDKVETPPELAKAIIDHFKPCGRVLDPCRGSGSFYNQYPDHCTRDWCEIDDGRDFLTHDFGDQRFDWIVTNPPWSRFRPFLNRAMSLSDNIVFLCLTNAWFMKARQADIKAAGFGMVEVLNLPQPPKPWPQTGFSLSAAWVRRGWTGGISISQL